MSEEPKIESSAEGPKSEQQDPFADFTKNLNARLSGKEIDLDTYTFYKQTIDALRNADDPKKELNALLSGKKIKMEDFKRLREITDEIVKGKEPPTPEPTPTPSPAPEPEPTPATPSAPEPPPTADQRIEEPKTDLEKRFGEEFGITETAKLEKIPGYGELTDGQKEMVFENLRQVTLGRIQEEAQKEYRKNTAESKFLGRVWQGISKRYQIAKLERAQSSAFESGGIASHGKYLEKLIAGAREGPEAIRNKDGTLEIKFVSENAYKELVGHDASAAEGEFIDSLNASIANFAKIPDEWALPTATKKEKKAYEAAKEEYENARHALIERMNHGRGGQYALEKALNLDEKVSMTQFLSSHPDVEKELQTINSKKLWVRALQNVATERGLYFAFGTASRSIAVGLLGALGAPIAAASMGGFIAHRRAKETVSTEARMSRRGQVKTAEREKSSGERVMRESRDYAKAEILAKRIDFLIQRLDDGDQKSGIHLKHLDRLVQLTESKLEDGLVNFGKDVQRIENQFTLTKRLGIARAHLFKKKRHEAGLEKALFLRERLRAQAARLRNTSMRVPDAYPLLPKAPRRGTKLRPEKNTARCSGEKLAVA